MRGVSSHNRRPHRVYGVHPFEEFMRQSGALADHVAQVRGKLGEASPIRTVRGVGYSVEEPDGR